MVASCLGSPAVPDEVVEFAARADGVPFMVEELLAAALSSGALVAKAESWRVRERAESLVPRRRRAGASVDDGETITDRIAAWARLLPYDHSPAARRIGDRVPQHDGRTGGAQLRIRPGNSACPGAGLITGHDAGVKPSVRRVVAVRCGERQAVWEAARSDRPAGRPDPGRARDGAATAARTRR